MNKQVKKRISEVVLAVIAGFVMAIVILFLTDFSQMDLWTLPFFLLLCVVSFLVSIFDYFGKYGLSIRIIELGGIFVSLAITILYARTVSLTNQTMWNLVGVTACLHGLTVGITILRFVLVRKKGK